MKRILTLALLSLTALLAIPGANAQGQLRAHIPFAFAVGDTPLPAGDYTVSAPTYGVVRLVSSEKQAIATVAVAKNFNDRKGKNVLVFRKYGNRYFLSGIQCDTIDKLNVSVPLWRLERKARSGEGILVAAR